MNWLYSSTHTEPTNEELGIVPWMPRKVAFAMWVVFCLFIWMIGFIVLVG